MAIYKKLSPSDFSTHRFLVNKTVNLTTSSAGLTSNQFRSGSNSFRSGSHWQLEDHNFVNTKNRESNAIDVGMVAKAITGAALDRGWDVSYNICFHNDKKMWPKSLPFVSGEWGFRPVLMMTLGKANKYFHERLSPDGTLKNDPKYNTNPLFETIFEFWDKE